MPLGLEAGARGGKKENNENVLERVQVLLGAKLIV